MTTRDEYFYEEPRTKEHGGWGYQIFHQNTAPGAISAEAHIHDVLEILYVDEGSFQASVNGCEYDLCKGNAILFCSREIHRVRACMAERNGYYVLKIDPVILFDATTDHSYRYILPFILHRDGRCCCFAPEDPSAAAIMRTLDAIVREYRENGYAADAIIYAGCVQILVDILRYWNTKTPEVEPVKESDGAMGKMIYKAIEYIHQHYCEGIKANDCCRYVGLSYSYFSRTFGRVVGRGFSEYVNGLRCAKAEKLLLTTDRSVTEIALECGFGDAGYFIQRFKHERGVTPAVLRKSATAEVLSAQNPKKENRQPIIDITL